MSTVTIAFDLYGTLLSTESVARELEKLYGADKAATISKTARTYQLEYTWRINSLSGPSQHHPHYYTFDQLTRWSFQQATSELGISLSKSDEDKIMDAYNGLDTFPDADKGLSLLADSASVDSYIFSNGTASMLKSSMETSPALAKATDVLPRDKVISVEALRVYKPDPRVYEYLVKVAGKEGHADQVWLVSSNPFDVVGAIASGLKSAWVGRGAQWSDGIGVGAGLNPTIIANGVDEAITEILKSSQG